MRDRIQQQLIHDSLESITGSKLNKLSETFFTHLFHLSPEMADVLNGDVAMLHRKFNSTLATLKNARYLDKISASIEAMALRHVGYGAEIHHFTPFRQALLMALHDILGDAFTPEQQSAWEETFDAITEVMLRVLQEQPQTRSTKTIALTQATHLLDAIGGSEKVYAVHQRFYDAMFNDAYLGPFFHHRTPKHLVEQQTAFMVAAFGGENHYQGQPPAFIHMHMFITREMSDIRTTYLRNALIEEGMSEDICQRWLAIDHAFHASIEKKQIEECVMRAVFQQPLTVTKPANYQPPIALSHP